jgi:hypothetical protein
MYVLLLSTVVTLPDILQVTEHRLAPNARIVHLLALIASLQSQPR